MSRDRNIGPFPFRLGAGRVADTEPTLEQALKLWWNWSEWRCDIAVAGGSFPFTASISMPRLSNSLDERMQRQNDDGAQTVGDQLTGRAHVAEATVVLDEERAFAAALALFTRGHGPFLTAESTPTLALVPTTERGTWNGTHVVPRRSRLVAGRVQPSVAFEMTGSWGTGASEYFWNLSTLAPSGDFTATVTLAIPGGGSLSRVAFGATTPGFDAPASFVVNLTPTHLPFIGGGTGPIYAADGTQLKAPLKSRVP